MAGNVHLPGGRHPGRKSVGFKPIRWGGLTTSWKVQGRATKPSFRMQGQHLLSWSAWLQVRVIQQVSAEHMHSTSSWLGLFPIRYRRDFSVSGTGSAKLEPCRYMPDIVSAELTSYRYDIVKYRADTIIGADICIVCIIMSRMLH